MPQPGDQPSLGGPRVFVLLLLVFFAAFGGGYAGSKFGLQKPQKPIIDSPQPYVGTAGVPVKVQMTPEKSTVKTGTTPPDSLKITLYTEGLSSTVRVKQSRNVFVEPPIDVSVPVGGSAATMLTVRADATPGPVVLTAIILEKNVDGALVETTYTITVTIQVQ